MREEELLYDPAKKRLWQWQSAGQTIAFKWHIFAYFWPSLTRSYIKREGAQIPSECLIVVPSEFLMRNLKLSLADYQGSRFCIFHNPMLIFTLSFIIITVNLNNHSIFGHKKRSNNIITLLLVNDDRKLIIKAC